MIFDGTLGEKGGNKLIKFNDVSNEINKIIEKQMSIECHNEICKRIGMPELMKKNTIKINLENEIENNQLFKAYMDQMKTSVQNLKGGK